MWLLFTVTILLTREVLANVKADDYDEEKNMEIKSDNANIFANEMLTSDLKMLAAKLFENDDRNEEQDTEKGRKRSLEEVDMDQEIITTEFEKRNKPGSSWFYWPEKEATIKVEERSSELNQDKKNSRFSPWGGKRIDSYLSNPEFRQTVHVFNSWGGKRGNEISKRVPRKENRKLYAWNRVGSDDNMELKRVSKGNVERKVPFNSWGGKRAFGNVDFTSTILEEPHQLEGKIGFRNRKGQYEKTQEKLMRKTDERRMPLVQKFESWGGKRFARQEQPENLNLIRGNFFETIRSTIPKKRTNRALRHRSTFQPWGGKRSRETTSENQNGTVRRKPASYFVRKVFFPWGG